MAPAGHEAGLDNVVEDSRGPGLSREKTTESPSEDSHIVTWDGPDDPEDPRNFSTNRKIFITFQLGLLAAAASMGSSILSPATAIVSDYVGVSEEVGVLSTSLYILGFAVGPLIWAPVSEIWGRRISMLPACFCLGLFSIGTATSKNAQSVFLTRFFAGVFGSAPVSNVSAALGDIWTQRYRGVAVTFYAAAVVGGPTLGPVIGSALTQSYLGWRWTEYVEAIFVFFNVALDTAFFPEVYAPVLLARKARRLRKAGDEKAWHPHENRKLSPKEILTKHFSRPLRMLITEPVVTCIAFYASFVYALLYLTLEVFPIVFQEDRGYSIFVGSLPFLGLFVGVLFAVGINLGNQKYYFKKLEQSKAKAVPEARLPPMMIGAILFPIGLFWFGWTADPRYSWVLPTVAAGFIGAGFSSIFQQCINILVDSYGIYAASAVSANTFLRSILAAGFPMFARPMFHNLGVGPAMSILGGIAVLAIPIPFVFKVYGKRLRARSKYDTVL